jgi:transposase
MAFYGIDVHKRDTQLCAINDDGSVVLERRFRTERAMFADVFRELPPGKVLLESSTESEWVARCLEGLGREVIVADPNFGPMYATRHRRVKTDRRDARTLAEACRLGAYRKAHRMPDAQRRLRKLLDCRALLVRMRTKGVVSLRAALRLQGVGVKHCDAADFVGHVEALELPREELELLKPLLATLKVLTKQIERSDRKLKTVGEKDAQVQRLASVPGVGIVSALSFVATLGTADRFAGAHQVEAFIGLVPAEKSSGEKQHRGQITKAGNSYLRSLLVQCAWSVLVRAKEGCDGLREWALNISVRRGKNVAVVALARKLAGILYALWRDGTTFEPARVPRKVSAAA